MPYIEQSSYKSPFWPLSCGHVQTIVPSFFRPCEMVDYRREVFHTPDEDEIYLDWAQAGEQQSDSLVIISHGLCGHTQRHYVLSLVKAFNAEGWDALAWNFRGTGGSPGIQMKITTNNSTNELDWIVRHAIAKGYKRLFFSGYSMGGNLTALYFGREWQTLPPEVCGGAVFCATTDLVSCSDNFETGIGLKYAGHFLKSLAKLVQRKAEMFPCVVDPTGVEEIKSFMEFDNRYTAPICGFKNAMDYYTTASACRHYKKLRVPLLMVEPKNDPFLSGECYPVEEARQNRFLYLEIPKSGGHCGFITLRGTWWPARRAVEFMKQITSNH